VYEKVELGSHGRNQSEIDPRCKDDTVRPGPRSRLPGGLCKRFFF
jgi:hypothetical protein